MSLIARLDFYELIAEVDGYSPVTLHPPRVLNKMERKTNIQASGK